MIKLANLEINGNLILAPMAGYTDSPFRRIAKNYGAALVITEMISADGIIRNNKKTRDLLRFSDSERPIGIQIFGNEANIMIEASKILEDLNPDFIDINLGCPARRVIRSGSGAALLSSPELIAGIASQIVKNLSIPVSAKIRIGIDADNKNYKDIVNILHDSGISFISVHGRTKSQGFSGEADWDVIKEIKEISKIPVIGNGDIKSHAEALERLESSGCDAVMIGRGAIGNPWIFTDHIPRDEEIFEQIKEHLDLMQGFYGEKGLILFRKHVVKYIRGMKSSAQFRASLVNTKTRFDFLYQLESYMKK